MTIFTLHRELVDELLVADLVLQELRPALGIVEVLLVSSSMLGSLDAGLLDAGQSDEYVLLEVKLLDHSIDLLEGGTALRCPWMSW